MADNSVSKEVDDVDHPDHSRGRPSLLSTHVASSDKRDSIFTFQPEDHHEIQFADDDVTRPRRGSRGYSTGLGKLLSDQLGRRRSSGSSKPRGSVSAVSITSQPVLYRQTTAQMMLIRCASGINFINNKHINFCLIIFSAILVPLTIFYSLGRGRAGSNAFFIRYALENIFPSYGEEGLERMAFKITENEDHFWEWFNRSFVELRRYRGVLFPVGAFRLRQLRVQVKDCDLDDYGLVFTKYEGREKLIRQSLVVGEAVNERWVERNSNEVQGYFGLFDIRYPSSGLIVDFDLSDVQKCFETVEILQEANWIRLNTTRLVTYDVTLYNPNSNLFAINRYTWEISGYGGFEFDSHMEVHRFTRSITGSGLDMAVFIGQLVILIILALHMLHYIFNYCSIQILTSKEGAYRRYSVMLEIHRGNSTSEVDADHPFKHHKLNKQKMGLTKGLRTVCTCRCDPWFVVDLLSFVSLIAFFCMRTYAENVFRQKHVEIGPSSKYYNLRTPTYCMITANYCLCVPLLQCFRVLRALRYVQGWNYEMATLSETVFAMVPTMVTFILFGIMVLLLFAMLFHTAFGANVEGFRSLGRSLVSLVRLTFGDFDYDPLHDSNQFMGPALFVLAMIMLALAMVNLFIAMMVDLWGRLKDLELERQRRLAAEDPDEYDEPILPYVLNRKRSAHSHASTARDHPLASRQGSRSKPKEEGDVSRSVSRTQVIIDHPVMRSFRQGSKSLSKSLSKSISGTKSITPSQSLAPPGTRGARRRKRREECVIQDEWSISEDVAHDDDAARGHAGQPGLLPPVPERRGHPSAAAAAASQAQQSRLLTTTTPFKDASDLATYAAAQQSIPTLIHSTCHAAHRRESDAGSVPTEEETSAAAPIVEAPATDVEQSQSAEAPTSRTGHRMSPLPLPDESTAYQVAHSQEIAQIIENIRRESLSSPER
ncbi:unnamed protein product [Vitrella brassicaformis CCMP3155]|uniref:Polycystin cation channel PKD1/PKD2 domain-containing protein n=1 Tax=Vitrella brassicaformis (strain CCMP3155) TaxID=1169540 RepID=A0A0G4G1Y7_VITBC|nr:unnamed protein product [Vitrella brassicaformis CCMP3155]|eukprot:CEM22072.1 unnamed protein product [Vitrella brassicaformis CCMP3155]